MIDEAQGRIDYDESGSGSAVVLLPGSAAPARRPVVAAWATSFAALPQISSVMVEPASAAPQAIPPIHATPKQWSPLEEMSVPGQKQKWLSLNGTSALPSTADIRRLHRHVRFVPTTAVPPFLLLIATREAPVRPFLA
jgi:hypothetical protein